MRCHLEFAVSDGSAGNDHDSGGIIRVCSSAKSIGKSDDAHQPL